jgi:hypothetical protein
MAEWVTAIVPLANQCALNRLSANIGVGYFFTAEMVKVPF